MPPSRNECKMTATSESTRSAMSKYATETVGMPSDNASHRNNQTSKEPITILSLSPELQRMILANMFQVLIHTASCPDKPRMTRSHYDFSAGKAVEYFTKDITKHRVELWYSLSVISEWLKTAWPKLKKEIEYLRLR